MKRVLALKMFGKEDKVFLGTSDNSINWFDKRWLLSIANLRRLLVSLSSLLSVTIDFSSIPTMTLSNLLLSISFHTLSNSTCHHFHLLPHDCCYSN